MADAKRKLMIEILSDASGVKKGFGEAEGAAGGFGKSIGKIVALTGGVASVAGAVDLVKDSIGGAVADEASVSALALQMKNLSIPEKNSKGVEDFIGKLSLARGVADDELRPAFAQLIRSSGDVDAAMGDLSLAQDIAAAKGISVAEASDLIAKANNGNMKGLKSLGISLKDNNGVALDQVQIFDKLRATFKGAGEEAANTGEGKMRKMTVAFGEMKEKIGYALLPIIEKLVDWVTSKLIPAVEQLGQWIKIHVLPTLKVLADFIFQQVVPALHAIFDFLMDHKEILIGIGVAILASLVPAFVAWATTAGAAAVATIAAAAPIIALGVVIAALVTGVVLAVKLIIDHWSEIVDFFEALPGKVLDFLKDLPDKMLAAGKAILTGLLDGIKWLATTGLYEYFIGLPLLIGGWILDIGKWLFDKGKDLLGGLLGGIKDFALNALYQYFIGIPLMILGWIVDADKWLFDKGKDIAVGLLRGIWDGIDTVINFFTSLPSKILGWLGDGLSVLWQWGKDLISGIWAGVKAGWNWFADQWNKGIGNLSIPKVHILGTNIDIGGWSLPDLPHLAAGGIVTRPTLAMIGEAGPEAVIPLNGRNGMGSVTNYITINLSDMDGSKLIAVLKRYTQQNGPGWMAA